MSVDAGRALKRYGHIGADDVGSFGLVDRSLREARLFGELGFRSGEGDCPLKEFRTAHSRADDNESYRMSRTKVIETRSITKVIDCRMASGTEIKQARERLGWSQKALAEKLGISQPAVKKIESGETVKSRYLSEARTILGIDGARPASVPLVGFVGAGAAAHLFSEGQGPFDDVEAPDDATESTVCVEIRGTSLGELFDQWLVFYDDVHDPPTSQLLNKLCVVGLNDGRILIKKLMRGQLPGLFNLLSNTEPPLYDQEIAWAAKVKTMRPR